MNAQQVPDLCEFIIYRVTAAPVMPHDAVSSTGVAVQSDCWKRCLALSWTAYGLIIRKERVLCGDSINFPVAGPEFAYLSAFATCLLLSRASMLQGPTLRDVCI